MGRWMDKAKEMEAARKAGGTSAPPTEAMGLTNSQGSPSVETTERLAPKFPTGQHVLITDNGNRVRRGVVQFVDWLDEPLTAKGWWYCILDVYGLLSETHESRLIDTGLAKGLKP